MFELVPPVGRVVLGELVVPGGIAPMLGSELFPTTGNGAVLLSPAGVITPAVAAPVFTAADGVVPLVVALGAGLLVAEVGEPDVPVPDSAGASMPAAGDAVVAADAFAISCQFTARAASSMSQRTRRVIRASTASRHAPAHKKRPRHPILCPNRPPRTTCTWVSSPAQQRHALPAYPIGNIMIALETRELCSC